MIRRIISSFGAAVLAICLSCCNSVTTAKNADVVVSLQVMSPIMTVNGADAEIDAGRDTTPVISDGRTLVPIRAIIEAFGGDVRWEEDARETVLTMNGDEIRLVADSDVGYLNGNAEILDTPPTVINGRTMLPIRFVAEGFNLGVAWDDAEKRVYIISNRFEEDEYERLMKQLPEYSGTAFAYINGNKPYFEDYEIIDCAFEYYASQDELGRCDVCFASVAQELMPTEKRESISSVKPTGWINAKYDSVDGGYLYNRCHLIGYQLTGENANERNLITGTRYLNVEGMLPFENEVADYVEDTGNNVMYRVTPVFTEENFVADGVLMEAYSVEDNGKGICFCVYCYNVQPQIEIDYGTGASSSEIGETEIVNKVYRTPGGKRYHSTPECGGKNSYAQDLEKAIEDGLTPCAKCMKK